MRANKSFLLYPEKTKQNKNPEKTLESLECTVILSSRLARVPIKCGNVLPGRPIVLGERTVLGARSRTGRAAGGLGWTLV